MPIALQRVLLLAVVMICAACTSLGHAARAEPRVAKQLPAPLTEVALDGDDNELALAVEQMLEARGVRVRILSRPLVTERVGNREYTYREVQTRYVVHVRSEDLDTCVPEGSRQMHFTISVTDFLEESRLFLADGRFGCRDTVVKRFAEWLNGRR